jgi:signal transduction histidine kinase/CheY-like chemotaxis protein
MGGPSLTFLPCWKNAATLLGMGEILADWASACELANHCSDQGLVWRVLAGGRAYKALAFFTGARMSLPTAQPIRLNPYLWLRRSLPSRMRRPQDFFYVSFSLSALLGMLCLAPWLQRIGFHDASDSLYIACLLVTAALAGRFAGLPRAIACWVYQACLLGLIVYNAWHLGGVTSPVMAWLGIVPFLPFFTMSRLASYLWMLASFAFVWVLYFLQISVGLANGLTPGVSHTPQALAFSAGMFSLMCLTQMVLVASYDAFMVGSIRAMKRKSDRLEKLSEELQQANSHKDKFLAMVSHDMRTPLNAIMGYLSLIQDEAQLSTDGRQYSVGAYDASTQLLAVINDLLDFSQIRSGKLALSPQVVHLQSVLERAFQTLTTQAHKRGLRYHMHLADNLPEWVRLDPFRLTQMLNNLLGNAIKFTPHGYVRLEAELATTDAASPPNASHPEDPWLLIRVRDSGIGIALEEHQHIFEPFVQVTYAQELPTPSDNMRGIGLGLSITHSLAESFGGSLSMHSQIGLGSTFSLRLPLTLSPPPENRHADTAHAQAVDDTPIRVLVIDDNPVNRLLAATVLQRAFAQATVDQAPGGVEGLRLLRTQRYDLAIIDLIMPDLHGAEVVRQLRRDAQALSRTIPVIALTASLAEDARRECVEAGMDDIMPKPFDRATLIRQVRRYAIHPQRPASPPL